MSLNYKEIESKWREKWETHKIYRVDADPSKPKYYVLDMFPYPSGAGLHVGHPLGYIASDIYSRFKRMNGFNVLHPMGFDAFGLPAEEYAIQTGIHPAESTRNNINRYCEQLKLLGFSYDWERKIETCSPEYYKWTQWVFAQFFEHYYDTSEDKALPIAQLIREFEIEGNTKTSAASEQKKIFTASDWSKYIDKEKSETLMNYRLAYRKIGYVNWCEALGTVLANDQIKDGVSERGNHPVIKKAMTQWNLRITAYAERLLNDLTDLQWSDALKTMQTNWIGRSEGATVYFDIENRSDKLEIYTTRPDTIFGVTFMVLAPEHNLVESLTTPELKQKVDTYILKAKSKSEVERMADKRISGIFTGSYSIHPFTKAKIPIWISEYVLVDYGTGAIMAVPSDDDRDRAFALHFKIPIIDVVDKSQYPSALLHEKVGKMINSDFINGMEVKDAIKVMYSKLEDIHIGSMKINYKLRDANFSRQRYWGEPFPIVYDENDIPSVVKAQELPVILPYTDNFKPGKSGESPLSRITEWAHPQDNMYRETDTMPAVAGSSWYYLRYMDPDNSQRFAGADAVSYWQDVDLYIGGAEHAVSHLMYARLWHKFLFDLRLVPTNEPFKKLINQGMILGIIEFIALQKDKVNGVNRFASAEIAEMEEHVEWVKIPVHIDFVNNYGLEGNSYLDIHGIRKFLEWRSDYKGHCTFENTDGRWTDDQLDEKIRINTFSEVGKMSKSLFNVINPDQVVERFGADCFRMYEMFLGPIEQSKPWDIMGIDGVSKFLKKYISLFFDEKGRFVLSDEIPTPEEQKILHQTIKKVSEDIDRFAFNTCVSAFMICVNELKKLNCNKREVLDSLNRLLAPFAPYITEEISSLMGRNTSIHKEAYPPFDPIYLEENAFDYPICFNGKKRGSYLFSLQMTSQEIEADVRKLEIFEKWVEGKSVQKIIVVPKRMINVVTT